MNSIQTWNPFKELETMQKNLSDLFGRDTDWSAFPRTGRLNPALDISEDKEAFHFKMDLPDMKKEDIKVEFSNGVLTISGEKKFEKESKNEGLHYHRVERSYGSFMRSFNLPENANGDKVIAGYDKGVLDVKIEKKALPSPQTKKITVT